MEKKPIYYLAAPYTHPNPEVRDWRVRAVTKMTYQLFKAGRLIYSPLTHNIEIDKLGIFGDFKTWLSFDHGMLSRLDGLIIFKIPGWNESKGLKAELEFAQSLKLPIEEIIPSQEFMDSVSEKNFAHS